MLTATKAAGGAMVWNLSTSLVSRSFHRAGTT